MDDQNKNLILATALSFGVILIWFLLFPPPEAVEDPNAPAVAEATVPAAPEASGTPSATTEASGVTETAAEVADAPRIEIATDRLSGSISLQGGRIDDLKLNDYRETLDEDSPIVSFLTPSGEPHAYYALYGWAPGAGLSPEQVPSANTLWSVEGNDTLTTDTPVVLAWDNGNGQIFRRTISVDENYLFTVNQSVENNGVGAITLAPYGTLTRHGEPEDMKNFFILHEGAMLQGEKERTDLDYSDIADFSADPVWGRHAQAEEVAGNGWMGFTDHYWMAMLIPQSDQAFTSVFRYSPSLDTYEAITRFPTMSVEAGASAEIDSRLFAGAKEWATIRDYERNNGIFRFIDTIDWGWFFFLTKPIFALLHWLNAMIGNMGWAIIGLTVILKIIVFPLAYKSYASMAKMKELQPEMEKLKEAAGDDRQKMQQSMMELYKKEKVNPAAGCLPILIQIPIFFSLYKVIFVTLELRHAPWFGWITDLSMPDPSSIFNLFGLLPFVIGDLGFFEIFSLGILPILLGVSMWLQQKLNPAPTDPTQQMIFAWMPWVFMFMLGSFASGLVVYWITNNVITFVQQYAIMRQHGYKPDVFGNIKSSFKKKPKEDAK
ncbi:protein translocase subunit yidC [Shimia isoporae]|uniref:Membrane protein insertase YidC n=1 Tax=Shimia isoporae TaxID=647720 RepID=A0A4R1N0R2_9RHOB|nr:membrane protein insertase YidC [Shimia isoporae]TCK99447.1 protein translocase subunit yidC [Shimia isoporae]